MELVGSRLEDGKRELVRQVHDRETARDGLGETAGRVRVASREGDEVRPLGPSSPLDGDDPSRRLAFHVHLELGLLEDPVPDDRVPDRILLDERANVLPIGDGLRWRGSAMSEAGKKSYFGATERIS